MGGLEGNELKEGRYIEGEWVTVCIGPGVEGVVARWRVLHKRTPDIKLDKNAAFVR